MTGVQTCALPICREGAAFCFSLRILGFVGRALWIGAKSFVMSSGGTDRDAASVTLSSDGASAGVLAASWGRFAEGSESAAGATTQLSSVTFPSNPRPLNFPITVISLPTNDGVL